MIERRQILENPEIIKQSLKKRNDNSVDIDRIVDELKREKDLKSEIDSLRHESKQAAASIGELVKKKANAHLIEAAKQSVQEIKQRLKALENDLAILDESSINQSLLEIPNVLHESVPVGIDESANVEVRKSQLVQPSNLPPDHVDIGKQLDIIDLERASKIAGSRFALLRGGAARLELALIQFMIDQHTEQNGYEFVLPPYLVNANSMTGTGQLPKFADDAFVTSVDNYYLVPTAEVPVTNMYANEIIDEKLLPIKLVAFTPCFRREAGSYGRDTRGLIRQHQFHKVELVKFVRPEKSFDELESLTRNAETILKKLELPYRVISLCSGDIGFAAAKCYDIEVWMANSQTYREISSCSNFTDFQARRAGIRYRPAAGGKPRYLHTINGSGLAVGRTLIAILEYYYDKKGFVHIPEILQPYMRGAKKIEQR